MLRRHAHFPWITAAVCLMLSSIVMIGTPGAAPLSDIALSSSNTSWASQWAPPLPEAVSCTSESQCVAVGDGGNGSLSSLSTTDGGTDWINGSFPTDSTGTISGVSCIDALHCWAVGTVYGSTTTEIVYRTSNGGMTWSDQSANLPSPGDGSLAAISCLVVSGDDDCWAAGGNGTPTVYETTDGGTSWGADELDSGAGGILDALSCVASSGTASCTTASDHYGVTIYGTSDGGSSWSSETPPSNVGSITTLSCPSTTMCFGAGTTNSVSDANGGIFAYSSGSWSSVVTSGWFGIGGLSCFSATDCQATGMADWNSFSQAKTGGILTWNGSAWSSGVDSGSTPSTNTMPGSMQAWLATSVSCATADVCVAVGPEGIIGTEDSGVSWQQLYYLPGESSGNVISCPSSSTCYWAPGDDVVWKTVNAGASWTPLPLPSSLSTNSDGPVEGAGAISCSDTSDCSVVTGVVSPSFAGQDDAIYSTSDGGSTWYLDGFFSNGYGETELSIDAISCPPSTSWCLWVATRNHVGTDAEDIGYTGAARSGLSAPSGPVALTGTSCVNSSDCWITGSDEYNNLIISATTDGGVTWTNQTPPSGLSGGSGGVWCISSTVCYANGGGGNDDLIETTDGGSTWSKITNLPTGAQPSDASCPDASDCVLTNYGGSLFGDFVSTTNSGSSWTTTASPTPSDVPSSVSCTDADDCWAPSVDDAGEAMMSATNGVSAIGAIGPPVTPPESSGGSNPSVPALAPCGCFSQPGDAAEAQVGEPVNTADGDFYQTVPMVAVSDPGAGLSLSATYDSLESQAQNSESLAISPEGPGWTTNTDMNVTQDSETGDVTFTQEDGSQSVFDPTDTGPDDCTTSSTLQCYTASAPRVTATLSEALSDGSASSWTVDRNGGYDQFVFAPAGELESETVTGFTNDFSYGVSPGSSGCPSSGGVNNCTVETDASGRTLVLGYNSSDQLIEAIEPGGATWQLDYESGQLSSITSPTGGMTSFGYDASNSNTNLVDDMTSVISPDEQSGQPNYGSLLSIEYNSDGQVESQTDGTGATTTFSYTGSNMDPEGGTTTVTDANGNETTYLYASGVLASSSSNTETSSPLPTLYQRDPSTLLPTMTTDPTSAATMNAYDSQGNLLVSTDPDGNTTQYSYNSDNQVVCEVDPADTANGVVCPTSAPSVATGPGCVRSRLGRDGLLLQQRQ